MTATVDGGSGAVRRCEQCSGEVVTIRMKVDGSELDMDSCQPCELRRWRLAGEEIDLKGALAHVGEHAGRRR